jgi:hypothetical protein
MTQTVTVILLFFCGCGIIVSWARRLVECIWVYLTAERVNASMVVKESSDAVFESALPGSKFQAYENKDVPPCQVFLVRDKKFIGGGYRLGDYLITAGHCLAGDSLQISKSLEGISQHVSTKRKVDLAEDAVAIPVDSATWARLGVKSATVGVVEKGATGTIYGPNGKSYGLLTSDGMVKTMLQFEGSTAGGYSGCPYMVLNKVVGLHLYGATGTRRANAGIRSQHLEVVLRYLTKGKPESSEDFWTRHFRGAEGEEVEYERNPYGTGKDLFVHFRGKTYDVSEDNAQDFYDGLSRYNVRGNQVRGKYVRRPDEFPDALPESGDLNSRAREPDRQLPIAPVSNTPVSFGNFGGPLRSTEETVPLKTMLPRQRPSGPTQGSTGSPNMTKSARKRQKWLRSAYTAALEQTRRTPE